MGHSPSCSHCDLFNTYSWFCYFSPLKYLVASHLTQSKSSESLKWFIRPYTLFYSFSLPFPCLFLLILLYPYIPISLNFLHVFFFIPLKSPSDLADNADIPYQHSQMMFFSSIALFHLTSLFICLDNFNNHLTGLLASALVLLFNESLCQQIE